jgi:hypothetical protein
MLRIVRAGVFRAVLVIACLSGFVLQAQQPKEVPMAPVPPQILAAKKVFVSNAGVDGISLAAFERLGGSNRPYNQFYAAMKSWGRYELVSAPADAELVFEIRFSAPLTRSDDKLTIYAPQFGVTILDTKTHFTLWTLAEPVQGAFRKATWEKNLGQGVDRVIDDLRKLAADPVASASNPQK